MKTETIVCDQCNRDLATTTNCEDYRIVVKSERVPSQGGAVTAMAASPDFPAALHFCGYRCFQQYFEKQFNS